MKINSILEIIGNTPVINISDLYSSDIEVWMKLERQNPGGSIKDRIALAMIEEAEKNGILNSDSIIIEPTSGNTGVGLAMVSAVKKYRLILVMPESMSIERRNIMKAYGAEIVLTPKDLGMKGAINKALDMRKQLKNAWVPSQFDNPANPEVHKHTTAIEIMNDFPEGFDYLVTGVGTGGHISGVGEKLKKTWNNLNVVAVEPKDSPVISGGNPGPHAIQGIGAGFIPKNLNNPILDEVIMVSKNDALSFAQKITQSMGIFVGISTGASLAAIELLSKKTKPGSKILTFNYDTGERYLSVKDFVKS